MTFETLKVTTTDGVRWITVNRPDKLNALSMATVAELGRAIEEAAGDDAVVAVVITGAGDKAFVAGADIAELHSLGPVEAKQYALRGQAVFASIERLGKPVVAAVNGYALGGGCELAMACHLRVAASNAVFGQPEVKLGLIPGFAGTQRLPRLVGRGRAIELLTTGRNVTAEEAERIGLVNRVCEPVALTQTVNELLAKVLGNGPTAVAHCLEAALHGLDMSFDDGCLLEATLFGVGAGSAEMKEGTSAFLEKRKPSFRRQ
ncbi:MAG TPA: enoyl-CoA hydratase-related protein [Thermoanaerobaculales bacterium]|nr:enoyl-CoA hydratase-related protein [Thermoanaerobaculales bacterium]HPA81661.1 enoyl-CoA hydratase-related protein [Thermoanaerobaculales bacterium]